MLGLISLSKEGGLVKLLNVLVLGKFLYKNIYFYFLQVATALLVVGSTPTFWRPQFVCTSSYSSVVHSARLLV